VIAIPDDNSGERVHTVVVTESSAAATPDELMNSCREHIVDY
jgi:acyl-CoA synthetase (AMP-forming)/AMP-acid ligase II